MKMTGTVASLNVSPKGSPEGLLLQTKRNLVQVNFSKEQAAEFGTAFAAGEEIAADVEEFEKRGEPAHPVFTLLQLLIRGGKKVVKREEGPRKFSGTVESLNYALHGEVNGGILDTGDFLHVKPGGARAIGLAVGMAVKGTGQARPMASGGFVIEAEMVNGTAMQQGKGVKKAAAKKKGPKKH